MSDESYSPASPAPSAPAPSDTSSVDPDLTGSPSGAIERRQYNLNVRGSKFIVVAEFEELDHRVGLLFGKKKKDFKPVFMRLGDFETLRSRATDIASALVEKLHGARFDTEHNKVGVRELFGKYYVKISAGGRSIYLSEGEFARLIEIFAGQPVASTQ